MFLGNIWKYEAAEQTGQADVRETGDSAANGTEALPEPTAAETVLLGEMATTLHARACGCNDWVIGDTEDPQYDEPAASLLPILRRAVKLSSGSHVQTKVEESAPGRSPHPGDHDLGVSARRVQVRLERTAPNNRGESAPGREQAPAEGHRVPRTVGPPESQMGAVRAGQLPRHHF